MTGPERLELLLPWLNDARTLSPADVRRQLKAFLTSFDGAGDAGYVRQVYRGARESAGLSFFSKRHSSEGDVEWPDQTPEALDEEDALFKLRVDLRELLRAGFPPDPGRPKPDRRWWDSEEFPSLWFAARGTHAKAPTDRAKRRSFYAAAGSYTLLVDGTLVDLVRFLVAQLLTQPGMALVSRCPAPAPDNWDERCGRFLISKGCGRPRKFCSDPCRVRAHAERLREEELRFRRPRRRARRKR